MSERRLRASAMSNDPRVHEAKRLLAEAARDHRDTLTRTEPAIDELVASYRETLERFSEVRGGNLFYPYLGSGAGNGTLVELDDGSVKLDLICGIGVHYFGHGDAGLAACLVDAALGDTVMQGNLQQNGESARLGHAFLDLSTRSGAPLDHCFLTTSGAMANENALKLAFHRQHARRADRGASADRILAFGGAFAGRTLALSQVTDNPAYRVGLPTAVAVDYVPFFEANDPQGSTERSVAALEDHLARHPGKHAVMMLELVQGEGGYYPGERSFFEPILTLLREREITILFDEIQTFGRTHQAFAFQHFGLDEFAEIVTVGKASQVCATLFADSHRPPPGLISQTFTGASSSIAAALYTLDVFNKGHLFAEAGRVAQVASRFTQGFEAIAARHPKALRGPFGLGAMLAFTPFDGDRATTRRLLDELFERGVIAFSTGGKLARVRFLPPVAVITDPEIDRVLEILEASLEAVASDTSEGKS